MAAAVRQKVGKNLSVKADLLIYSNGVTVSGQCLSVAIIISNKMDFNSCAYMVDFPKSSFIFNVVHNQMRRKF